MSTQPTETTLPQDHPLLQPIARRYAAIALCTVAGWGAAKTAKLLQCSKSSVFGWVSTTSSGGSLSDKRAISKRKGKTTVADADFNALSKLLDRGGTGQLKIMSLRRAYVRHVAGQRAPKSRKTYRRALHAKGWRSQAFARAPAGADMPTRERFCAEWSRAANLISSRTTFSDSKIFPGEPTSTSTLPRAWAPKGQAKQVAVRLHPRYQAHVYAAINKYGASPLEFVPGTRGPSGASRGRPRGTVAERAAAAAAAPPKPPKNVTAEFYQQNVLPPLLRWSNNSWGGVGVTVWNWQQDGAGAHTTADNTPAGRAGKAAVAAGRGGLLEGWPAHSPDLSPIEKAWADCERELWSTYRWTNLPTSHI